MCVLCGGVCDHFSSPQFWGFPPLVWKRHLLLLRRLWAGQESCCERQPCELQTFAVEDVVMTHLGEPGDKMGKFYQIVLCTSAFEDSIETEIQETLSVVAGPMD